MSARPPAPLTDAFLPDRFPGERELLRLDVIRGFQRGTLSLRTRRDPAGGGWRHRLVDEYGTVWRLSPARSLRPLDADRTLSLLDSATRAGAPFRGCDFTGAIWAALRLDEIAGAVQVRVCAWPALAAAFAERERAYLARWGAPGRRTAITSAMHRHTPRPSRSA